jgi:TatD DNase family protein
MDAHIHLDMYDAAEREMIFRDCEDEGVDALIAVSFHLESARENLRHARDNRVVKACFGYHPEQAIPNEEEVAELFAFMDQHREYLVAVGEVGLPYYLRQDQPEIPLQPYVQLLEKFVKYAARYDLPIVLHAVYDDGPIVCDLLEKHSVTKAHFHWFKGDEETVERMVKNGYFISITPDVLYEKEIQELVKSYPLSQMMVETDGPWQFEGPFKGQMTHPRMIHQSVGKIAELKQVNLTEVYLKLHQNTKEFFRFS